jgi:hypothetical protein
VMPHPEHVPTPPRMRQAAVLVVVITSLVGLMSAAEAFGLGSLEQHRHRIHDDARRFPFVGDPELLAAANDAQMSALEGMKTSRGLVLGALAGVCVVGLFSALRLMRPDGVAREGIRRVLVGSLLLAAGLRTVDGAQWAVVAQRSMRAAVEHLQKMDPARGGGISVPEAVTQPLTLTFVLLHTALMAGALLLLGQYFRSEKIKQLVALQDRQLER